MAATAAAAAPRPLKVLRRRSRSLGTMAMARPQEKSFVVDDDNEFASDDADALALNEPKPWYPPPPTVLKRDSLTNMRRNIRKDKPRPLEDIPPLPPLPKIVPVPLTSAPPLEAPLASPGSPFLARMKSQRKTILERIEGWWDLGLLEKRQTLFKGGNGLLSPRKA